MLRIREAIPEKTAARIEAAKAAHAAAAAKFAVLPVDQGGAGLRRVCIIDFDVHHGNGTEEILSALSPALCAGVMSATTTA